MTRNSSPSHPWLATLSVLDLRVTFARARAKQTQSERMRRRDGSTPSASEVTSRRTYRAA